ncbi:MAG: 16S rRNA (cytidine(1402)-2'-O)-methyltransferase [Rhodobacteraceae bacterium]|nr:16S rRNA (cytidine(1402)-2'-O)-methyltransferase [Paracoccaceae bacterium]
MNWNRQTLAPGLYLVATPIGTARDITLRALDVLASADVLVAEDTRTLRKLMDLHAVPLEGRPLWSYHDHSRTGDVRRVVEAISAGQSAAYASEAGTPLIADPGYELVGAVREAGGLVTSAPGPSALATALSIAGLPTDAVHFAGFLQASRQARRAALAELGQIAATLVLYESPKRVSACLADASEVLGTRHAALARELTKRFEEVRHGTLAELAAATAETPPKGECVILIDRSIQGGTEEVDLDGALQDALTKMSLKEAVTAVSGALGLPRRKVYQRALDLKSSG